MIARLFLLAVLSSALGGCEEISGPGSGAFSGPSPTIVPLDDDEGDKSGDY